MVTTIMNKRNKLYVKQLQMTTAGVLLGTSILGGGLAKAEELDTVKNSNGQTTIIPEGEYIEAENSFLIDPDAGKTKPTLNVTGTNTKPIVIDKNVELPENASGSNIVKESYIKQYPYYNFKKGYGAQSFLLPKEDVNKTTIEATYPKSATYQGNVVDIKVKYYDFKYQKNPRSDYDEGYFILSDNFFSGFVQNNIQSFKVDVSLVDQNGQKVDIKGDSYITFNSLNYYKPNDAYIEPDKGSHEFVQYLNKPEKNNVYLIEGTNVDEVDYEGSKVYGGINNDFIDALGSDNFKKNSVSFQVSGDTMQFTVGSTNRYSQWTSISSSTMFNVLPSKPTKDVSDQDEKHVKDNVFKQGESLHYSVNQKVHSLGVNALERYKSFKIIDKLPSQVTYKKDTAKLVKDGKAVDDKGQYEYDEKTHTLTYTASKTFLETMEMNGETYNLEFETDVKDGFTTEDVIKNEATSVIDGREFKSNPTTSKTTELKPSITKKIINKEGQKVNQNQVEIEDTFKYEKVAQFSNKKVKEKRGVSDEVPKALKINDVKVMDEKGQEITKEGDLKIDEKTNTYTWFAKDSNQFAGKMVQILADVTLRDDVSLKEFERNGQFVLPNTIKILEDGHETPSNTVETILEKIDFKTEKVIVDKEGKEVQENEVKPGESYTYRIKTDIPNDEKVETIKIEDDMNDVIQIDGMKVYLGGQKMTSEKNEDETSIMEEKDGQLSKTEENQDDTSSNNEEGSDDEETVNTEDTVQTKKAADNETTSKDEDSTNTEEIETTEDKSDIDTSTNSDNVNQDSPDADKREEVTKEGASTIEKEKSSVKWENEKPDSKYRGGHLETDIDVTIPKDVDLSKLKQKDGQSIIDNVAISTVNDEKKETNQVITKVPKEAQEEAPVPEKSEEPKDPEEPTPENPKTEEPQEKAEKELPSTEQPQSEAQEVKETPQEKPNMIQSVLPKTGTETMTWLIVIGGIFIAGGLSLLKLRKKNSEG